MYAIVQTSRSVTFKLLSIPKNGKTNNLGKSLKRLGSNNDTFFIRSTILQCNTTMCSTTLLYFMSPYGETENDARNCKKVTMLIHSLMSHLDVHRGSWSSCLNNMKLINTLFIFKWPIRVLDIDNKTIFHINTLQVFSYH